MSDTSYSVLQHYGTNADRLAFTPAPPASGAPIYLWYESDTDSIYIYTTAWHGPIYSGSIVTTGTPAAGELIKFSASNTITNGNLSGDVTTTNTLVTTIAAGVVTLAKIANAAANSRLVGSGSAGVGIPYAEIAPNLNLAMSGTNLNVSVPLTDDGNSGTALTMNFGSAPFSSHKMTLTGNVTLTFSNPLDGGRYNIKIATGAGGFSVTWPVTVLWPGGTAPTITATASKVDMVWLVYDSVATKYYGRFNQNY